MIVEENFLFDFRKPEICCDVSKEVYSVIAWSRNVTILRHI